MAEMADNSEKKKTYEEALEMESISVMLEDFEDYPEKLLRVKRAMLHCICQGMDAKTKDFRKKVKKLAKGNTDIQRHDDVYKFEGDQEDQNNTGKDVADSRTRDITPSSPDTFKADSGTENVDQDTPHVDVHQDTFQADEHQDTPEKDTESLDSFQYTIGGGERLAVYIGIGEFEMRGDDGESDGTGAYDDRMKRRHEEVRDRENAERTWKDLGFTFRSNRVYGGFSKVTKVEVDEFIKDVLNDDAVKLKKVEIIVVLISSHGEEVKEQDETNKDKNILRHRILLEDKYLYTDELLKQFEISGLRGIPKLFFIQACRSGFDATREDVVDKGVSISVEVKNTKDDAVNTSDAGKQLDLSDARPRNRPKVAEIRKPGSGEVVDTNVAKPPTNISEVKLPIDTSEVPENDVGKDDQSDVNSGKDKSDAKPKNSNRQKEPQQSIEEVDDTNETKSPENIPQVKPSIDNSEAKPSTETQKTNPAVDTTIESIPQQEEIQSISCIEDSLVMFASSAGKEAYRKLYDGGWLMTSLCSGLDNWKSNQDQDLLQVLTGVIGKIAIENETGEGYKSAACFSHMLTKDIYLCPKK